MTSRRRCPPWLSLSLLAVLTTIWPSAEDSASAEEVTGAEPAARYPFDPVCPWGRIADGRGMLVRCLTSAEAARFASPAPSSSAAVSPSVAAPSVAAPPVAAAPRPAPAPAAPALAAPAAAPARSSRRVAIESVGPAVADTGELPEAQTQLARASDRYVQCVESNGGISASPAKVTLRFLVRERGRAEGLTVKDRAGLSLAAAKCIADVVDRRFVGYPAAPIVGADLSIAFVWEGAGR